MNEFNGIGQSEIRGPWRRYRVVPPRAKLLVVRSLVKPSVVPVSFGDNVWQKQEIHSNSNTAPESAYYTELQSFKSTLWI